MMDIFSVVLCLIVVCSKKVHWELIGKYDGGVLII